MNSPQTPLSKPLHAAAIHGPVREALWRKRRQLGICLLLALIVVGIYPSLRDRLIARDFVQRVAPGQILISTPKLFGGPFRNSELLIVRHDDQGTWALVLGAASAPIAERHLAELFNAIASQDKAYGH